MIDDGWALKELFDNKTAELKNKALNDYDDPYMSHLPTMDSTFLGPILWEDTLPISDLDNINLEEFSPEILQHSAAVADADRQPYLQGDDEQGKVTNLFSPSTTGSSLDWTEVQSNSVTTTETGCAEVSKQVKKKSSVPVDQRNEKYWSRRMRNNASAKRSRDARRMMENQVHIKATVLERENEELKMELYALVEENKRLRDLLNQANIHFPPSATIYSRAPASHDINVTASSYQPILPKNRSGAQSILLAPSRTAVSFPPNFNRTVYDDYC